MGFDPKLAVKKGARQLALNLIAVVVSAALAALSDPDFWTKALDGSVPPALVLAAVPVVHAVQEVIRNFVKHGGK